MDNLDRFIDDVQNHPKVNDKFDTRGSSELLRRDREIAISVEEIGKLSDIKLKETYGKWVIIILGFWVLFVCVFMFFQLFVQSPVSDAVLITLLTTTTANIIALPIIILKYLFPPKCSLSFGG